MIVEVHIHVSNFWFIGSVALDVGDTMEALKMFESCWHLRRHCLYRNHRDLTVCVDQVAKCYSMLGKTSSFYASWQMKCVIESLLFLYISCQLFPLS